MLALSETLTEKLQELSARSSVSLEEMIAVLQGVPRISISQNIFTDRGPLPCVLTCMWSGSAGSLGRLIDCSRGVRSYVRNSSDILASSDMFGTVGSVAQASSEAVGAVQSKIHSDNEIGNTVQSVFDDVASIVSPKQVRLPGLRHTPG